MTNPYLRGLAAIAALAPIGIIVALLVPAVGTFLIAVGAAAAIAWLHSCASSWQPKP